jgi:DNA-directed RNA polymerase subunit RPC12/RpoP
MNPSISSDVPICVHCKKRLEAPGFRMTGDIGLLAAECPYCGGEIVVEEHLTIFYTTHDVTASEKNEELKNEKDAQEKSN